MLRFPYLLSLLLCIELSFCYSYIDEDAERKINNLGRNFRREKVRKVRRLNVRRSPVHHEEDYDRSPVEFDVASFIQPEEDNLDTEEVFIRQRSNKRGSADEIDYSTRLPGYEATTYNLRWTPKQFDLGSMLKSDESNKMEKAPDYMSMNDNLPELSMSPPLTKDLINAKHYGYNPMEDINGGKFGNEKYRNIYKDDLLMNSNAIHNQEKKCSLKSIKFPFFSHNKSEPLKPKKNKKRKLFFFRNSKKEMVKIPDFNKIDDTILPYKLKRSYEQRLCPACKKIFISTPEHDKPKKYPRNVIHNSRQFYQNTSPDATQKEEIKDYEPDKVPNADDRNRSKREERERQLKELDAVQRKIEAVQIHVPRFDKQNEKNRNKEDDVYEYLVRPQYGL